METWVLTLHVNFILLYFSTEKNHFVQISIQQPCNIASLILLFYINTQMSIYQKVLFSVLVATEEW